MGYNYNPFTDELDDVGTGGGGGADSLNDLTDVTLTSPSNGEVLKYNGSAWVNDTDDTGGGSGTVTTDGDTVQGDGSGGDPIALADDIAKDINITGDGSASTSSSVPRAAMGVEVGVNDNAHLELTSPASTGVAYIDLTEVNVDAGMRLRYDASDAGFRIQSASEGTVLTLSSHGDLLLNGSINGTNFSGSSSGTNTGDQDLSDLGVTASASELNILDGATLTTTELNYVDGVTSAVQTQIDGKQASDSDLTAIAGLSPSNDDIIQRKAGAWTNRTVAQYKTDLALTKSDVGLGNVDNTSDSTKNSASVALTNKDLTSGTNTFPTLNQNTTGSAAKWTTARNLAGNSVDGSANVAFANKFIVQGTSDSGLSAAQFLGSLGSGLVKNTTTTGVLSIASAGTDYYAPGSTDVALADGGTGASLTDPNADRMMFWDDSGGATTWLAPGTGLAITNTTIDATAATTSAQGISELATTAETSTGTDTGRTVTPDGLAGSVFGEKNVVIQVTDGTTDVATGDGKAYFCVPSSLNGMDLVRAQAVVVTAGTTNATTVMIANKTDGVDMLSGAISIASAGTVGTVGTINTSTDDVATNDVLRIDVDSVSTTAPKGLIVVLEFRLP